MILMILNWQGNICQLAKMSQKEYFGIGSINSLGRILGIERPNKVFLVTGKESYSSSGAEAAIQPILFSYNITRFSDFAVNPKMEDIKRGISLYKDLNPDLVIAIGGGSVIDVAKAITVLAAQTAEPETYIHKNLIMTKGKPLVAIPTTSGSGSEATSFAVVYINKKKYSLAHEFILPNYVIIDPQFSKSISAYLAACAGMDAFSQAIESYWSVNSTEESDKYSKEAIKLLVNHLKRAVLSPSLESRTVVAKASNLAGKAINIARSTACHAISYPITSYFNVPHGHAVALTIPSMIFFNSNITKQDCQDKRGVDYVISKMHDLIEMLNMRTPEEAAENFASLMKELKLNTKLSKLGITTEEDIDLIIKNGFNPDRIKNNPRVLSEDELRKMLNRLI